MNTIKSLIWGGIVLLVLFAAEASAMIVMNRKLVNRPELEAMGVHVTLLAGAKEYEASTVSMVVDADSPGIQYLKTYFAVYDGLVTPEYCESEPKRGPQLVRSKETASKVWAITATVKELETAYLCFEFTHPKDPNTNFQKYYFFLRDLYNPPAPGLPVFELRADADSGKLSWVGHSVAMDFNAPTQGMDAIVEDTQAKVIDIGLQWSTVPVAETGEILLGSLFWRIPKDALTSPAYIITAKRVSASEVIFIMLEKKSGVELQRSPLCTLQKGYFGKIEDIAKRLPTLKPTDIPGK